MTRQSLLCVLIFSLQASMALAQPPAIQDGARVNSRPLSLQEVVRAKLDTSREKPMLVIMLPAVRMEKKEGTFPIAKTRTEQRTRIAVVDGKPVQQIYSIAVPYSEMVVDPEVPIPVGDKAHSFDAVRFRFYNVAGSELDIEEVAKRLDTLKPAFLMERFNFATVNIPEVQKTILREDCVVITTSEIVRNQDAAP